MKQLVQAHYGYTEPGTDNNKSTSRDKNNEYLNGNDHKADKNKKNIKPNKTKPTTTK